MKRQIKFADEEEAYRFVLVGDDSVIFEIQKNTLNFSTSKFYECFFKGVHEKPEYELLLPTGEIRGQAKHVYETVKGILDKACSSIEEKWFKEENEHDVEEKKTLSK